VGSDLNDFLEEHISTNLVPTTYFGNFTPLDDDCWILAHNHPLAEQDCMFAAIVYPETDSERILNEGALPALETRFHLPTSSYPGCLAHFCEFVRAYSTRRLSQCNRHHNSPVTITCQHATVCITFYPIEHDMPILIHDSSYVYIVPEHTIPCHWIDDSYGSSSSHTSTMDLEEAFVVMTGSASALAV